MPTYTFKDKNTGVVETVIMSMSERESYLTDNPHIEQLPPTQMNIGDPHRLGLVKPPDSFRELMSAIHKKAPGSKIRVP